MNIPHPVAMIGEEVEVENYRRRPAVWERGTIEDLEFHVYGYGSGTWSYEVRLDRKGQHGPIDLSVSDEQIRRAR